MHLFDLKRAKWPPRNQNHVHLHLPLLFRRILPNPRSHSNLSKAHPEHWYRNIHEKNVEKIGGSHMGGNYLRSASLRANCLLPTAPTRKSRRHRRVALELHKCIPRFNKNYIVPVEPAFRLWMRVGRSISNTPRILQISPEPGFPFCCIWSAHTGVTLLNCRSQNAGDGRCAHYESQTPIGLDETSLADPKFVPKVFGPHPNAAYRASTKCKFFYPSRGNAHRNFCLPVYHGGFHVQCQLFKI